MAILLDVKWYLTVVWMVFLWWLMMLSNFSRASWPSVFLLWRNVCSEFLPMFKLDYLSFFFFFFSMTGTRHPKGRRKGLRTITKSHIKLWELSVWSGPWQPTTHIWKGQSSWIQALWSFHTLDIRDTLLFLINSELVKVWCEDQGQWHSNFFFWLQNFHSNGKCPRLPRIIHTKHSCPD